MSNWKTSRELEEEKKRKKALRDLNNSLYTSRDTGLTDSDYAPVGKTEKEERSWFESGAFEDGYQFGDILRSISATAMDLTQGIQTGVLKIGEGIIDTGAGILGGIGKAFGNDEFAEDMTRFAEKDLISEDKIANFLTNIQGGWVHELLNGNTDITSNSGVEKSSFAGDKIDSLAESGGQLLGTIGLKSVSVPWYLTSGITSFGSEFESAAQQGASYEDAALSAVISAGAELISEKLFKGSGLGEKGLIDISGLTKGISNKIVKTLADFGVDMLSEGGEEIFSGIVSALGQKFTYADDKELTELFSSEDAWESFVGGALLSGASNAGKLNTSLKSGRDYNSGLTENEQKVFDAEYNDRLAEAEKDGKKLNDKEKTEMQEKVMEDLKKGLISTDKIESVLGGETYKTYQDTIKNEDTLIKEYEELRRIKKGEMNDIQQDRLAELKAMNLTDTSKRDGLKAQLSEEVQKQLTRQTKKGVQTDDYLIESYNERFRKSQAFQADVNQYKNENAKQTIQNALDFVKRNPDALNNGREAHDFIDFCAKVAEDKGKVVDLTTTAEMEQSIKNGNPDKLKADPKHIEAYNSESGNKIVINMDVNKSLSSLLGHEITDMMRGAKAYDALQKAAFSYAETKGELETRRKSVENRYKNVEADINGELTSDIVGDYLTPDSEFIRHLATNHRNVFQKIFDEIKHLCKLATAGSKEARQLEKLKHEFEKVWRDNAKSDSKANTDAKYSLGETTDGRFVAVVDSDILSNIDTSSWDKAKKAEAKKAASDALKKFSGGIVVDGITRKVNKQSRNEYTRSQYTESLYNQAPKVFADKMRAADVADDIVVATTNWNRDGGLTHPRNDSFVDFDHGRTLILSGNAKYSAEVVVGITEDGEAVLYDVVDMTPTTFDIKKDESSTAATTQNAIGDIHEDSSDVILPQKETNVNTQYSLSDSETNGNNYNLGLDNQPNLVYNEKRGDTYARTDEFRNLQAESQGMSYEDTKLYWSGSKQLDDEVRGRLSRTFGLELRPADSERIHSIRTLLNPKTNKNVNIVEGVDGSLFHDVFEISRKYLRNGELVDLHGIETTEEHGIGYNECYNYLSEDGLSGFSITPDGDLISVFNLNTERGFLKTIAPLVKENAKTLDCYASPQQNLMAMYENIFGFKTASVMDYNMEYDHDNIAENHNYPKVAFMVNTDSDVETKNFTQDQYNEAVEYRNSFVNQATSDEVAYFMPENTGVNYSLSDTDAPIDDTASVEEQADVEEDAPKIAQVLDSTPKELKKTLTAIKARNYLVDKHSAIEDLSLKTKNRELMAKADFMLRSESRAQRHIKQKLMPILEKIEATGKRKEYETYSYHLHNIDRMSLESKAQAKIKELEGKFGHLKHKQIKAIAAKQITPNTTEKTANTIREAREWLRLREVRNKPVFDESVTADVSRDFVKRFEAENPGAKEIANSLVEYNNELRKILVEGKVISQKTADLWAEQYPNYVPIQRDSKNGPAVNVALDTNRTGVDAPIKAATGGNSDMESLLNTMATRTEQIYRAIARNSFGLELMHTLDSVVDNQSTSVDEVLDTFDNQYDELLQEGNKNKNPTFTVFENGERITFEITEELYEALKPTNDLFKTDLPVMPLLSKIQRGLLTQYNPAFIATNAIKDIQDVLVNSQHPAATYAEVPEAIKQLVGGDGKWITEYMDNGGEDLTYFDSTKKVFKEEDSALKKILGFVPNKIAQANDFIEKIPRLAEYIASRKKGASIEVAMLDAARVTTNFAAGGEATKWANRNGFTFLNASVQGAAQQVRNIREAKANGLKGMMQLAAKVAVAGLPVMLLNHLLWNDDEEYEELSDYVKDNYYIVAKYGDGQFVRIPKGRISAVIQSGFEQMRNLVTGDDDVDMARFGELLVENIAPNNPLDNNVLAPIGQAINNKTWYGDDLVPTRLQDLPEAEQYDESTDVVSKWLGEKLNISPYKINYLLDQYSGGLGDMILPSLTPEADGDGILAPLMDKFTTDSVMKNQNISDFYDIVDKLTKNANSAYATDEDILSSKYMNSVSSELSDLYKKKREIQNSWHSDSWKSSEVRKIQEQINALTREALNSYGQVYIQGNYAIVGDRYYKLNDKGTWTKISESQLKKQKKISMLRQLGFTVDDDGNISWD